MKPAFVCLLMLTLGAAARGEDIVTGSVADESIYETDRPGELENPFTVPPGRAELVNYLVALNAADRADAFGAGGSAVYLDTALRFGVAARIEGVVTVDTFLAANPPADASSASDYGLGYTTLLVKWNVLKDETGDFGVAVAPFVRLPLERAIGATSRAATGLVVPFDIDLEGGWELEGSSGFARTPDPDEGWSTQWENQVSLQRTLTKRVTAYWELELESGDGPPGWATEFGVTCQLNSSLLLDLGGSVGIGRDAGGWMSYAGIGWRF